MSSLYVNESGAVISIDGGYFCVKGKNDLVTKIPKELLESITVFGNSSITTPCMQECLRRGVAVNYFSGKGAYYGRLSSTRHENGERLKAQIFACSDPAFCLAMAQKVIAAKIRNQSVLLRRYQRRQIISVEAEIEKMRKLESQLPYAETTEQAMGLEGRAARIYFSALSQLVQPDFEFSGRSRQPPRDAFNSMLSLGYTILMYELYAEIENRGFTPYVGFMHSTHRGHPCLASDLMEEWRAIVVDSAAMSLVQGNEISISQFEEDEETGGIILKADGMKIFIRKLQKKFEGTVRYLGGSACSLRRCFYLQSVDLAKAIESRDPSLYQPVLIR